MVFCSGVPVFRHFVAARLSRRTINTENPFKYAHGRSHQKIFLSSSKNYDNIDQKDDDKLLSNPTSNNDTMNPTPNETPYQTLRIQALHTKLEQITNHQLNPKSLHQAAHDSLTTTKGYDPQYGKSAIRAYRAFLKYPPKNPNEHVEVAATRTARQIDFLVKRHKSQQTDWIRHLDPDRLVETTNVTTSTTATNTATNTTTTNNNISSSSSQQQQRRRVFPLSLILDNVRSAFNVGSLFRTADACGCTEIITTGITPHPGGNGREKLQKCALGADQVVPTRHFDTTLEAIQSLRLEDSAVTLVGMETTDRSICYTSCGDSKGQYSQLGKGTYLILGNEVSGVDTEIMDLLDTVVEIPMFGAKNSLNIAASAPVVMYEILRQWGALEEEKAK